MYQGLLHLHNLLRWVILILAVIAIVKAFAGMTSRKPFTNTDKKIGLFLMVAAHIMFMIGLFQWLAGDWGINTIRKMGMGEVMKNSIYRYWAIEHITGMVIAIALITVGRGVGKKNIADRIKHQRTFWFYLVALLIILVTIPWPFREGIGRPLFPGMGRSNIGSEMQINPQFHLTPHTSYLLPSSTTSQSLILLPSIKKRMIVLIVCHPCFPAAPGFI